MRENTLRYRIFDAGRHMIQSVHMKSCLTAQKRFLMFKGPGSFKKIFKIGENVDELKAYRLIPLTHPLLFHFTLPLRRTIWSLRCIQILNDRPSKNIHVGNSTVLHTLSISLDAVKVGRNMPGMDKVSMRKHLC